MMIKLPFTIVLPAVSLLLAIAVSGSAAATLPVNGQVTEEQRKICSDPIRLHERAAGIPNQLLAAVARAESGRWDKTASASFAWPWTVTAEGKGQFFASKDEAIDYVKRLQQRGVRNIDVGCMQINLMHHPDAFADLEEALDPNANVAYATDFLKELFEQSRSWVKAVGNYHSATPEFHMRYRQKVMQLWSDERRRDAEARRQEAIAAYQQRRLAQPGRLQAGAAPQHDGLNLQVAAAETPDALRYRFAPQLQPRPAGQGAISARDGQSSFRVMSQIPAASAMSQPSPSAVNPLATRVLPRTTAVPLERRF